MPRVNVKDRRRKQLIDANIASIARRGLTETTITHVSEGAGLSRGIVNFYFTTKEAMMLDTLKNLAEEYDLHCQEALAEKKNAPPEEQLQALVDANFDSRVCSHKRLAVWSAFWGHAASHKDYGKVIHASDEQHIAHIAELWEKLCERSGAKSRGQGNFPQSLHSMIRGAWLMLLTSPGLHDAKTLTQMCQRALQESMSALEMRQPTVTRVAKPVAEKVSKKVIKLETAQPKKPKKKETPAATRQLDFADLFGG